MSLALSILQVVMIHGWSGKTKCHTGWQNLGNQLGGAQGSQEQLVVGVKSDLATYNELVEVLCDKDHSKSLVVQLSVVLLHRSQRSQNACSWRLMLPAVFLGMNCPDAVQ